MPSNVISMVEKKNYSVINYKFITHFDLTEHVICALHAIPRQIKANNKSERQ